MKRQSGWQAWLWSFVLALALVLMLRSDRSHVEWVSELAKQGSPAPARDPHSPTGYALGQRQFLGTHERGETYRWIAATQDFVASGPFASPIYYADNVPVGRPQLMPKLFTAWLATLSWGRHSLTGEPLAISAEQVAPWEPVISHALAFAAVVAFMWIRYGATSAGVAGLFFALFPPISAQFLPGVLTSRTWALLLAAYAIALNLPRNRDDQEDLAISTRSAVVAGLALWLNPAIGFPVVLISAASAAVAIFSPRAKRPFLKWSLIGSGVTLMAWLIDRTPWSPAAGELRYVHPLYALAWLGIGVGLDGWQNIRGADRRNKLHLAEIAAAIPLVSALFYTQLNKGYEAWLYPAASMRRLTSLNETTAFNTVIDWIRNASGAEIAYTFVPLSLAVLVLVLAFLRRHDAVNESRSSLTAVAVVAAALLALSFFQVRWILLASLVALPLIAHHASRASLSARWAILAVPAAFSLGLVAWGRSLPPSLQIPSDGVEPSAADLEALIYRHFSHWLASHNPGQKISALAPPELSDSLVFHGGCHVLMSTAWESYLGQVAASRILSAPESSEAEAVLQSREITHVILPSWDKVLPLLVRSPDGQGKETLNARLQRWVYPPYLRPIPYRLPSIPGYLDQKLVVFKVTPAQDEALSLSRLAEYFVEMDRAVPADLAAKVLAQSFPEDPNAVLAQAIVYAYAQNQAGFDRAFARLAADVTAGKAPFSWDRRVQRAIVLALGHRPDLARAEVEACLVAVSAENIFDLTPLQAYRLSTLAKGYGLTFPAPELAERVAALGAEYNKASAR